MHYISGRLPCNAKELLLCLAAEFGLMQQLEMYDKKSFLCPGLTFHLHLKIQTLSTFLLSSPTA